MQHVSGVVSQMSDSILYIVHLPSSVPKTALESLNIPSSFSASSRTLAELDERLQFKSNRSRLVPDADEVSANGSPNGLEDSQFEGITHVRL